MTAVHCDSEDVSISEALVLHAVDGLPDQEHPQAADRSLLNGLVQVGFRQFKRVERGAAVFDHQYDLILAHVQLNAYVMGISVLVAVLDDVADQLLQSEVDSERSVRVDVVGFEESGRAAS